MFAPGAPLAGFSNPFEAFGTSPADAKVVYAATTDILYRSADGGFSWTRTNLSTDIEGVRTLPVDPSQPSVIYIPSDDHILKTVDGGISWHAADGGLPKGWTVDYNGSPGSYATFLQVLIDPTNTSVLYTVVRVDYDVSNSYKLFLYKSSDAGRDWNMVGETPAGILTAGATQPTTTLYGRGGPTSLMRSRDVGESWQSIPRPAPPYLANPDEMVVVDPIDPSTIYVATSSGSPLDYGDSVYRSTDGGDNWELFFTVPPCPSCPGPNDNDVNALAIGPFLPRPMFAYFADDRSGTPGFYSFSRDGGTTWSTNAEFEGFPGPPEPPPHLNNIYPAPTDRHIAFGTFFDGALDMVTVDGGESWQCFPVCLNSAGDSHRETFQQYIATVLPGKSLKVLSAADSDLLAFDWMGPAIRCPADCDKSGDIEAADWPVAVDAALLRRPTADCDQGDLDRNGVITVDELVFSVHNDIAAGCPPSE
ncbi:MAG TPA: hypothetical protein VLV86_09740 [Vicinamibacterales bacterium]|nr:hypothetical protein [Vicinamibacterales bacterium]